MSVVLIYGCSDSGTDDNSNPKPNSVVTKIYLSTYNLDFETKGGKKSITVKFAYDIPTQESETQWQLVGDESWCTPSMTSGKDGDEVTFTVMDNKDTEERNAVFTFLCGAVREKLTVTQKQRNALTVTPSNIEIDAAGGDAIIEVLANIDFEYTIDKECTDWIAFKGTRSMQTSTLVFDITPNTTLQERIGKITIHSSNFSESITITQDGENPIIQFEDPVVKMICIQNWDTNGDDELSAREAAAIKSLGSTFQNEKAIRKFNELQHFIGLTNLSGLYGGAFEGCSNLTHITIPDIIKSIGNDAFKDCSSLTNIAIPNSVTSIGRHAFSECKSLTNITIPNSVTSIGQYAFRVCTNLTDIFLPESITSIGTGAFSLCENLININIPQKITSIEESVLYGCKSLTNITIPFGVTSIKNMAFGGCENLKEIIFPENLTSIGSYAFQACHSLTTINIPNNITLIGDGAFSSCKNLATFYGKYASTDNRCLICGESLIAFAPAKLSSYTIPENIIAIGENTFADCINLTNITIPKNVFLIESGAFLRCTGLTNVVIPDNVTSIGSAVFYGCTNLKNIAIGKGVKSIEFNTFKDCTSLAYITIPCNIISIEDFAFQNCTNLKEIYCTPTTPPTISEYTFYDAASNAVFYVPTISIDSYKTATGWENYVDRIFGYDFNE